MIFGLLLQIKLILLLLERGNSFKMFVKHEQSIKKIFMKNDYDYIDKNKKFEKIFHRLNNNYKNNNKEDFEKVNKKENNEDEEHHEEDDEENDEEENYYEDGEDAEDFIKKKRNTIEIIFKPLGFKSKSFEDDEMTFDEFKKMNKRIINHNIRETEKEQQSIKRREVLKSDNFEIIKNYDFTFQNIGGYDEIKKEMMQCVDMLKNFKKYEKFNVRTPKGLILEGPPGNGKTLLVRGFSGESKIPFISVSGSEFQEKYIGVGASKIRELFSLATKNVPCIIFIDEIDAVGRKRSSDGESSSTEKDNTLNELLVALDGFKTKNGIFVIGATNRIDLLDSALIRPGRIDKKIYIGTPDSKTRKEIIIIHINGKPYDKNEMTIDDLVVLTEGFSGAEIESLLNEAMLNALRNDRMKMSNNDIEIIINKMISGWQSSEIEITKNMIEQICVHEIGHVIVSLFCNKYPKLKKVILNLNSPTTPGYTLFDNKISNLYKEDELFEKLMILLGGRNAEEIIYNNSVTTGASNDFQQSFLLAEKMILQYGFGKNIIYSMNSDKTKEIIDNEIMKLINEANEKSKEILLKNKKSILLLSNELEKRKKLNYLEIIEILDIQDKENKKDKEHQNQYRIYLSE